MSYTDEEADYEYRRSNNGFNYFCIVAGIVGFILLFLFTAFSCTPESEVVEQKDTTVTIHVAPSR